MPSPEELSVENISSPAQQSKRKYADQPKSFASSRPASASDYQTESASVQSTLPVSKRLKTSHTAGNQGLSANMSKSSGLGFGPQKVIDLTGSKAAPQMHSNFQPNTGAKKLVVKNLRTASRTNQTEAYYTRTWDELDASLTSVFNGRTTNVALESLYRGVEYICRRSKADDLFLHFKARCKAYLEKEMLPQLESEIGTSNVDALRTIHKFWSKWNEQSTLLRAIFSYLDRSYLLNSKDLPQLQDLSIQQFRHTAFTKAKAKDGRRLGEMAISGMCDLVKSDRERQTELFDGDLLKNTILMLHIFSIYSKSFEPEILKRSKAYFEEFAEERATSRMKDYIASCDNLLNREATRCDVYNFDSTTKRSLHDSAHHILIESRSKILLDKVGLATLIETNAMPSLKILYNRLSLSKIQGDLKQPFEAYIKAVGSAIVTDLEKVDQMVVRLLELKRSLDIIIRDAFEKDESFTFALREAFGNFINDRKNTVVSGNSKTGEMIAKYMDQLLRGGLKAVPRSLTSDAKDRDEAEKQGVASTGDEDAELDRQLEQALELFRFIEGKDVFEAFYKKDLARRLLMSRSASQDAERNMLAKLKIECGSSFTHNLEQMFKDQEIARDEMAAYKEAEIRSNKSIDLQVTVLSAASWPSYPDIAVNLPAEVTRHIEKYDRHYVNKHSGRRLIWKPALSHSVLKAHFKKGSKELLVSAFQAVVLLLFNSLETGEGDQNLSYGDIQSATGLVDAELKRTLQSLACGKFRILTKHPKGREVNATDTFTVNTSFGDPKYRIKINQIQLKETPEENKDTHERVQKDRQYETQAAIVRVMKSRKSLSHPQLVAEVIEQTKKRGAVEVTEIKEQIDKLLDKDYLERDDETNMYVYVA
ncbi:Cullin family-domain-containing protein [Rhexocercosporidium sp. MPI-PUGE-AT-0058]|nr:Cullin family-domain-containing protein [Rhexocercosporidium sp. MPI-PUGE-AT-0058]